MSRVLSDAGFLNDKPTLLRVKIKGTHFWLVQDRLLPNFSKFCNQIHPTLDAVCSENTVPQDDPSVLTNQLHTAEPFCSPSQVLS